MDDDEDLPTAPLVVDDDDACRLLFITILFARVFIACRRARRLPLAMEDAAVEEAGDADTDFLLLLLLLEDFFLTTVDEEDALVDLLLVVD